MIYLDNNATTTIDPRVADVIAEVFRSGPCNASSQHAVGRAARLRIDDAIDTIASCLDSPLDQPGGPRLIFTSGGTESNNLALSGLADPAAPIVLSRIEHPSVIAVAEHLATQGREIRWLDVDGEGVAKVETLAELIQSGTQPAGLVSLMSANNETGVIQPIDEAARICRQRGTLLHVDATQSIGKVPLSLSQLGASAVTMSAHKFHGPPGIGALWLDGGVPLRPLLHGGEQQLESRPGTEPVALICGMALALQLATAGLHETQSLLSSLRDRLEQGLRSRHADLVVHGCSSAAANQPAPPRLPNTTCLSFPGADRQSMLMALDFAGIALSSGSACSSGSSPPSHVLLAMGKSAALVQSALRLGVSKFSTVEEIDDAIDRISLCYKRLGKKNDVEN
ncbi:Cysteine desulfurase [Novipirellula galeiformis]|uniref:Cysteine desulfurase n=1 Tax=Novipirellula galeiformis TaxID=2528004 RepID=A0A5C6CGN5_9BACT|nr:cysteine desulfurase family protein [Novipirellula galeiformis]TWU23352.1 Cysteine desulfurase [Novipirellula galeiformis]